MLFPAVVPGSHKWDMRRAPDLSPESDEWAPAIMPKGSVIIYLSHTLHSGGENRTDGAHLTFLSYFLRKACLRRLQKE